MDKNYKYDAFISYRHKQPDKSIAERLQKLLEGYKPPKEVMPEGFKHLHIFRDETELVTGSDLSDGIKKALGSSEYLIVVCSKQFSDSRWCLEEIEYFKSLHHGSNSNIITLVAEGEPCEVFPDALCNELVMSTDSAGNVIYTSRDVEPLAANISSDTPKAALKKLDTEFLRIAAPLIGCGYDDLYKRDQKRKTKRLITAALAAILFLSVFLLYSSMMLVKISTQKKELEKTNYDLKLKNSEILASQAEIYLNNDDRISAIKTAIDALPSDPDDNLPINALAESILVQATNAYSQDEIMLSKTVNLSGYADFLGFSEDGGRILASDSVGNIYIIDYADNAVIKTYSSEKLTGYGNINDIYIDGMSAYILFGSKLMALDLSDGSQKWFYDGADFELWSSYRNITTDTEADAILLWDQYGYMMLSKSGDILLSHTKAQGLQSAYMNREGKAYMIAHESGAEDSRLIVAGTDAASERVLDIFDTALALNIIKDRIYVHSYRDEGIRYSQNNSYAYRVSCFDKNSLEAIWHKNYEIDRLLSSYDFNCIFDFMYADESAEDDSVLVISGSFFTVLESKTGEILFEYYFTDDKLISAQKLGPSTFSLSCKEHFYQPAGITQKWGFSIFKGYSFDKKRDLVAQYNGKHFALASSDSSDISIYHRIIPENYTVLTDYPRNSGGEFADHNGILAELYQNTDTKNYNIKLYDTIKQETLAVIKHGTRIKHFGFSPSGNVIFIDENNNLEIYGTDGSRLHTADLAARFREICKINADTNVYSYGSYFEIAGNTAVYCIPSGIITVDLSNDEYKIRALRANYDSFAKFDVSDNGTVVMSLRVSSGGGRYDAIAYLPEADSEPMFIREKGDTALFNDISCVSISDDGEYIAFINNGEYTGVYRISSGELIKLPIMADENIPLKIRFTPDSRYLMVLNANGELVKYSASTLEKLGTYKLDFTVNEFNKIAFMGEDTVYVMDYNGTRLVDISSMKLRAAVKSMQYHIKSTDKLLQTTYTDSASYYTLCDRYGTEELIALAKNFLKEYE